MCDYPVVSYLPLGPSSENASLSLSPIPALATTMSIPPFGLALMACLNMATWASQDVTLHVIKVWLSEKVSVGLEVLRGFTYLLEPEIFLSSSTVSLPAFSFRSATTTVALLNT